VKRYISLGFFLLVSICSSIAQQAQEDTLRLTTKEAEALFLNNNLDLVAQKLSIRQSEAMIIQAKLWPNPEFSVEELNLWATKGQLSSGESLPPIAGNFGKNRQIAAALEQLIETGGKRKKRIALESLSRDMALEYFTELIRNLKTDLRNNLTALSYHQSYAQILGIQNAALEKLVASYERQYATGDLKKPDLFRLKALKLELGQQIIETKKEITGIQKELVVLLNIPAATYIQADATLPVQDLEKLQSLSFSQLVETALSQRPDAKISELEKTFASKQHDLELANRKPDLTLGVNYDRGGNFLRNFIGFGISMPLPVFNRNQGAIQESKIGIEKAQVLANQKTKGIESEVAEAFRNLRTDLGAYQSIEAGYGEDLDDVFNNYTRYFLERRINMVEYLDFFDAYLANRRTILTTRRQLAESRENLNYAVGTDIQ
jgi:cobalt-zinc-cadmium efflux system outer membrane protein